MSDVNVWLARAAGWRAASLLFQEPHESREAELTALASLVPEPARAEAHALAAETPMRAGEYYRVLGPGGCAAAESSYDRAAVANRGPLIADVAAFYEAFAYPPRLTTDLTPDHIVVELDFLGFLALKIAFALHEGRAEDAAVAQGAYEKFLEHHPKYWIDDLLARLTATGDVAFTHAARWVSSVIRTDN
jgi:TorA maturation chaperone TorD